MSQLPSTCTILHRTDTNEYLTYFEFWDRNSIRWSANVDEAFLFRTYSDAEINGRMILVGNYNEFHPFQSSTLTGCYSSACPEE